MPHQADPRNVGTAKRLRRLRVNGATFVVLAAARSAAISSSVAAVSSSSSSSSIWSMRRDVRSVRGP